MVTTEMDGAVSVTTKHTTVYIVRHWNHVIVYGQLTSPEYRGVLRSNSHHGSGLCQCLIEEVFLILWGLHCMGGSPYSCYETNMPCGNS